MSSICFANMGRLQLFPANEEREEIALYTCSNGFCQRGQCERKEQRDLGQFPAGYTHAAVAEVKHAGPDQS